jgi:hypothetical protein
MFKYLIFVLPGRSTWFVWYAKKKKDKEVNLGIQGG